jgi:hypothetical protein
MLGGNHVTLCSEVTDMRFTFRKRTFLNPISTLSTSYIHAHVEDSQNGAVKHGGNMLVIADCHRVVEFEFYLGTRMHRRLSLAKLNHLIDTLTAFRDALAKESELIENFKKSK